MKTWNSVYTNLATITALLAACAGTQAADRRKVHDELVKKDLFAVITLQGHNCGKVISFERQKQHDYVATCTNGKSFRIYVVPEGRVAVDQH